MRMKDTRFHEVVNRNVTIKVKVKVKQSHYRPEQAERVLRKLRFPDFVTTAQDGGKLSALHTGRIYLLTYSMVQSPS